MSLELLNTPEMQANLVRWTKIIWLFIKISQQQSKTTRVLGTIFALEIK
jgi:hypothetical protein